MLVLGAVLIVAAIGFTMARLFVVPVSEVPDQADAVVALDDDEAHVTRALELMNQQVAPVLVVSGGQDPSRALSYRLCTQPQPFEVLCPTVPTEAARAPASSVTGDGEGASGARSTASPTVRDQAEAQTVGRIATERGWQRMALVGLPEQLSRARLLVERCTTADVAPVMVETPVSERLEHLGGEAAGYLRALFLDRSC